ncbi:nucleolar protein 4 isoform X2 [Panthera pardus]|uniref:Nucleolar protein 4 helical domain-containing protein n=4 Tax=Felidae TaxID=9681 RepID=A0ABI7XAP0_FELCA|nr:nucleolar protein 4 isoform X3 [Felis catus]XP_019320983.1 nucleolar protein 4 isoform X2 [Panthera pardus]XP_030148049.1 nucleolar protein 4 isoform X2 [Lynx canadensis]XP_040335058.1 nucleolar protein 4 isoform X2 [Puma yagouaroundi]XP_042766948.1 nucleolar protein 4 isoform X2 [Panthera leo]XP_042818637.1 nucleolar protein 4 isoform X2 [Panthera tigris]XP_043414498.1 nucleolar protein 4 isoform X2 [Prionailurus bengalensis]XP_045313156.1 nucleolar protein 4 isoform X2 [Leopardus geoffr
MESERDMYRQFQDWCLRTYGDSGKTKTVTRKKYERIVQLLNGSESSSTDNAKFKFWVKSKGFQLGQPDEVRGGGGCAKQVLYVPVKTTDGVGVDEKLSLRRVAVVEDFFDIIYSMHVETGPNGEQIRKHAGQKRTYKAISESYAFLPREAVTRFLMSCSECQKRMHLNPDGTDHKDNGKPPTLVTSMIDYNMPITMAYMKHMKLQLLNSQQDEDESSIESDEFDMSDSTRMSAVNSDLSSNLEERMQSPQALHGQQDDDSAAESFNGNETLGHSSIASGGTHSRDMGDSNGDGKTGLEQDEQPLNLSDSPLSAQLTSEYRIDDHSSNGKNKYKNLLISDLKMEQETRENGSKSPAHSYSSYDSGKNESVDRGAEDLSLNRGDEDEDDHDDHDDSEKVNETDGVEAERLKAFNSRPIPSHLTSAVAESILASACESESRNAAKRMRLDRQQDESAPADKQCKPEAAQATYSTSAVSGSQEVLYINGNGTYSYHSYRGLGGGLLNLNDASSSGPTDLSMKRQLATSSGSSSSSSSRPQLSPTEINAVRQLVAGYRESAAFLLRSADELENLILQQN